MPQSTRRHVSKEENCVSKAKLMLGALLAALVVGGPAQASVLVSYTVTFTGGNSNDIGSGTLVLSLPSFPDNNNLGNTSLPNAIFSSLTATIGNLPTFTLTDSNIAFGQVQGTSGGSIDISMTESTTGLAIGAPILAVFNGNPNAGTYQINPFNQGGTLASGSYTIGAPFLAAVPEPSTWAMMILGFFGVGFLAYRRKNGTLRLA
jgi:hypothetical protein